MYRFLCRHKFLFWGNKCPEGDCWIIWEAYVWNFKKLLNYFPWWLYHFIFSPATHERFTFPIFLLPFGIVIIFYFNFSKMCIVVLHAVLIYISLMVNDNECLFIYSICHSYILFGKISVYVFCSYCMNSYFWVLRLLHIV